MPKIAKYQFALHEYICVMQVLFSLYPDFACAVEDVTGFQDFEESDYYFEMQRIREYYLPSLQEIEDDPFLEFEEDEANCFYDSSRLTESEINDLWIQFNEVFPD